MEITKSVYFTDRKLWHDWLAKNYQTKKEIWLVYPHKASGQSRLTYNDAVEEALSFGWIDSTTKKFDADSSAQRFTPRRASSSYSQTNIERLQYLSAHHLLQPEIERSLKDILKQKYIFPEDIMAAIRANEEAWANYQKFSPTYQRIRIAFIEGARKRPDEFRKRLDYFIRMTEKGRIFGFGGVEKHF